MTNKSAREALNHSTLTAKATRLANIVRWMKRGLNSESVDLVYLDPPFNSNRNYAAPVGLKAAGAAFKDTWTLSDLDVAWAGYIADEHPAVAYLLSGAGMAHGKGMQSYLTMMAVRLLELHRVLAPTGSLWLHCDSTASHYLKLLLDAVFGQSCFRNEVVWRRHGGRPKGNQHQPRTLGRDSDVLLNYTASDSFTWHGAYSPLTADEVKAKFLGCMVHFEFRHLTVDHIVPRKRGGTGHKDNLQLLCGHCNSVKGDRPMEYLLAQLAEVTLHKRVADGVPRLAWILGGVVAVGVGSPVASPPELTGRLLPWRP